MVQIVNLTSHEINVRHNGTETVIPPSGIVCRCELKTEELGEVNDIPVVLNVMGEPEGIPPSSPDTIYLVSTPAAQAAARMGRLDVFSPDTGKTAIRDEKGLVRAVVRFQRF